MQMSVGHSAGNGARLTGVACGIGAGALWGLVFLAPELVRSFHPVTMTIGRYLAYGLIAGCLIGPRLAALLPKIGRREWLALFWLSLAGNTVYYVLLSKAVQTGGIAMTSLVVGFLPVAVSMIGSRDQGAVPLRRLALSLTCCVAGAICIGWQAIASPAAGSAGAGMMGLLCAVGALVSWTAYAVGNSRWLVKLTDVTAHEWSLLTGLVTGAQAVLLIPFAVLLETGSHGSAEWTRLIGVSVGVAVLASIAGNALWNQMSRLLPLTLVGQMILFETLFALLYGFVWEQRPPTTLELAAFALVVMSVVTCIAAHRPRNAPPDLRHPESP